ncbi:C-type lectin domain family 5 member A-like isoform X1 [Gopherus flavomarginatus]|uniref:C-type lectin domain-containing protein n=1 Tax=Gopherus agassizii TaxID=38772 RepID=A0A452IF07_9SAUR|nr:C-type lectin domain family 5 member A-like isoform X1 [Gopherus evgoodei]XP_030393026.1 C-type lectin domain family 5 member A-like isoform X1 [Gopherus evgoodei]XP_050800728.1 C-type lectin domain family 5 member A-like isoform X1 [Gopherus flavomarginatus]XP_050800737.1 C-type lectin domain family 5 member A-like isoform X1 [Gopherus flavomarginatus]
MNWQLVIPGLVILPIKLVGTSLFLIYFPQIFPMPGSQGTLNSTTERNITVLQTTPGLPKTQPDFSTITTTARDRTAKPLQWERHRGNYYLFSKAKDVWSSSRTECDDQSSDLVVISDRKELEFLHNKTRDADYFIGLTYSEMEKRWYWIDKTELTRSLFTLKPKTLDYENDCAVIRAGELSPASCHQRNQWICEKTMK